MTIKIIDAAFETTTTTGSGSYTLAGAQPGHQSFAAAGTGAKVVYQVNDGNASGVITQREIGIGTITISGGVTTLSRDSILYSTNSNAAVTWGAGTKNVIGSIAAGVLATRDENLNFVEGFGAIAGSPNALTLTLPVIPLAYSDGMQIAGFIATTNTTPGATIAVNGLSVKALKYKGADPGIGNLPAGQLLLARYSTALGWFELVSPIASPIPVYFSPRVMSGLQTALNAATPTTKIDISTGYAISPAGNSVLSNTAFTKQLNAAWAAGNGNGGLFSGSVAANTFYALWMIQATSGGAIDFGFDTIANGSANTNTPSGYIKVARIAYVRTDASSLILAYQQRGDKFIYKSPVILTPAVLTTRTLITLPAPPLVDVNVLQGTSSGSSFTILALYETYRNDPVTPFNGTGTVNSNASGQSGAGGILIGSDASSQIAAIAYAAGQTTYVTTLGWYDRRGKED